VIQRARIAVRGAVQGVGFRPCVYRLAVEMNLTGWVRNSTEGVFIEVQGEQGLLETFLLRLQAEKPARSFIQSLEFSYLDPAEFHGFEIRASSDDGARNALVLPDIAVCADCLADILDPANRRYRYPFTNCTNCGPRFTIIESLPYDRGNTSMKLFPMCPQCRQEYEDPLDRRFHAQPNACPACGPRLALWDAAGDILAGTDDALVGAAAAVRGGKIVAVKGLGGFHLIVDARNTQAVERLRARKRREEKPLALMFPSLRAVRHLCEVSRLEERLLLSPESPIVLLQRSRRPVPPADAVAPAVAPGNPYLGVMLPYTPLHHLLLRELAFPVVATSGNLSDEPMCIDELEARSRLRRIADCFLVHNRPIVRHMDDSIVRVLLGRELVLRRARGYAPLPISLGQAAPVMLAVGAHLKNTVALSVGKNIFVSQHIGDLETAEASEAFRGVIASFRGLYQVQPEVVVADMHPDYLSTKFAHSCGRPVIAVQHHYAHVAACMAENELDGPVLGVSWDGTGYGTDGTLWGGEFLVADAASFRRVATLRSFRLPGGASAIKEPRRSAVGALYEIMGDALFERDDLAPVRAFSRGEIAILRRMLAQAVNAPVTTSAGRLFDAVAAITDLRQGNSFEGQAAMELEFALADTAAGDSYPVSLKVPGAAAGSLLILDWGPMMLALIDDLKQGSALGTVAARFHNALVEGITAVARRIALERVALSGG
jgi:hydrogenase maturation protein HypF